MIKKFFARSLVACSLMLSLNAQSLELNSTVIETAALKKGLDPYLLYAVALAESARKVDGSSITPWPWTLRTLTTPYYLKDQEEAEAKLKTIIREKGEKTSVDIGFLQINLRWHGHRVDSPELLLDIETNLDVGATILKEAMASAPGDLALGIGRYHQWEDEDLSRAYGEKVMAIHQNLLDISSENRYAAHINR